MWSPIDTGIGYMADLTGSVRVNQYSIDDGGQVLESLQNGHEVPFGVDNVAVCATEIFGYAFSFSSWKEQS
jgi:hypothetical protein